MEQFEIKSDSGSIIVKTRGTLSLSEFGGYDLNCILLVKSASFEVRKEIWVQAAHLYDFYKHLISCQETLKGQAEFFGTEVDFKIIFTYDGIGHCEIKGDIGDFAAGYDFQFEMRSDQSFMSETLAQLKLIIETDHRFKEIL